jgi:hypothetical protein
VRERDESRHLAVGAGAPSDPDVARSTDIAHADDVGDAGVVADVGTAGDPFEPGGNGHVDPDDPCSRAPTPRTADDVIQAVTDFLDDLVDDPTFAQDPPRPRTAGSSALATEADPDGP